MDVNSRFAVYLIPPFGISQSINQIHNILQKQFGLEAADQFQVHATLKGFFKSTATAELLIENLDTVFARQPPIHAQIGEIVCGNIGIMLDLSKIEGGENHKLNQLQKSIVQAVLPYIAQDCEFSPTDLRNPFWPHITLAFQDIHPSLYDPVLTYLRNAPIPRKSFSVDSFHLLEFFSNNWDSTWWETLTWRIHKAWTL